MAAAPRRSMRCSTNGDRSRAGEPIEGLVKFGTVDWLFREYKRTKAYLEKVSQRSRRDYERTMLLVTDMVTKKGDRVGDRKIKAITPVSADKIYERIVAGPRGPRPRQGEKVVGSVRSRMERRASALSRCFQPGHTESVARCDEEPTQQSSQAGGHPRPGLHVRQGSDRGRIPGSSRGRGDLLRMAAAPRECFGGLHPMDGLSGPRGSDRDPDLSPQDRRGGSASATGCATAPFSTVMPRTFSRKFLAAAFR